MTREIGEVVFDAERTRGVAVHSRATHLCFAALGAEREGVTVEETWLSGAFETDPATRSRFLEAIGDVGDGVSPGLSHRSYAKPRRARKRGLLTRVASSARVRSQAARASRSGPAS